MSEDKLHALLSPSGSKKWMTCPGSLAMERGEPNEGSKYSDEGTAAHALAAMCLTDKKHPTAFVGRILHIVNGVYDADYDDEFKEAGSTVRSFEVDTEMAGHVNTYVQHILEYANGNEMLVEQAVPIGHITGEKGATGTSDTVIFVPHRNELQVHDLKFGMGVKVYAEKNPQGMMYLAGAMEAYEMAFGEMEYFRFVIHQPRLGHLDEYAFGRGELMAFIEKAKAAAKHATAVYSGEHPDAVTHHLVAGQHCKDQFCRARAKCPKLAQFVRDAMENDFEVLAKPEATLPLPDDATELGLKLSVVDVIQDWCKQVRAKCEAMLVSSRNDTEVCKALGYKLVMGKKGNRAWLDEKAVAELLKKKRLKVEDIYDLSVKSPTVITKALKDKPKWVEELEGHITQADGKPSVQPLDDKRDAMVFAKADEDFETVVADEDMA